jgi:hypothetical protein
MKYLAMLSNACSCPNRGKIPNGGVISNGNSILNYRINPDGNIFTQFSTGIDQRGGVDLSVG